MSGSLVRKALATLDPIEVKVVRAKYDAAQTNPDNRRHWANADSLSADAAASPGVRSLLRNRSRYEGENNGYMKGMNGTHAVFTIGTGPRLQMLTSHKNVDTFIEKEFHRWARKVRLAKKLRTMRKTKLATGEAFAILTTNPKLDHKVKLDLRLIEADRVRDNGSATFDPLNVDGIQYDADGNPVSYSVQRAHPGSSPVLADLNKFDTVYAAEMIHLYEWDRPEQSRGVPELTSSLPLFALQRRYTLAAVSAAETAAEYAAMLHTNAPSQEAAAEVEVDVTIPIERNMLSVLPEGWDVSQLKAEQPTTTYPEFKGELINEAARPINMPKNIATGNSSGYNYASGRLDHQVYFKSIDVERDDIEIECLDRVLEAWLKEASLIPGYLPEATRENDHQWFWDGMGHVDPVKEATAQEIRLRNHTSNLAIEFAEQGLDWEKETRQYAKEYSLMKELGLPVERPEIIETRTQQPAKPAPVTDEDDEEDDE